MTEIKVHTINDTKIAELTSDETIIHKTEDGLDLLGTLLIQQQKP